MANTIRRVAPVAALLAAVSTLALSPAGAQTIDYGALEQLFGEPVTTSATGKPQRASEAPVTMDIISADDIRRAAATDIPGILREYTTLDVVQWSKGGADVAVRGYNQPMSPRLLVLINGRQVYLDHYGFTSWSTLPIQLAEIRQIEVVKGPNTALFGFNAASGVINIITYNPIYDQVTDATVRVGTQDHREASFVHTAKLGEGAGVRFSVGGNVSDGFGTDGWVTGQRASYQDRPTRRTMNIDSLFQVGAHGQLGIEVSHSDVSQNEAISNWSMYAPHYKVTSGKLQFTQESESLGLIEATLYRNMLRATSSVSAYELTNDVTVAKLQDLFKIGTDHSVRLAGEYRRNTIDNVLLPNSSTSYDVYSVSGMWDWTINPRFSLTNAVRLDHLRMERDNLPATVVGPIPPYYSLNDYDQTMTEFSFNSGLVFKATPDDTFRATIGRGLQIPSLVELGILAPAATTGGVGVTQGNPTLDPMVVMNYELAYDRTIAPINGSGRISLFYQTSDDIKLWPSNVPNARRGAFGYTVFRNGGESAAYGVDASLKGKVGEHWRWGVGYIYERINDDIDGYPAGAVGATGYENSTAKHTGMANVGFTYGKFEGDVFARATSSYDMMRPTASGPLAPYDVPSALTIDARIAYRVMDNVTVALQGTSLNQADYRSTSLGEVERQVFLTLNAKF